MKLYDRFCIVMLGFILGFMGMSITPLIAQSLWLRHNRDKMIALEILKPDFARDSHTTFTTTAWFLTLRFPLLPDVIFTAEVPFAHYGREKLEIGYFTIESETENSLGNLYLGIELGGENSLTYGELGVRLPLVSEEKSGANYIGLLADYDRFEAFLPNWLSIQTLLNVVRKSPPGFVFRFRGGGSFLINTDKQAYEDGSELFILYAAQAGFASDRVSLMGGFSGRWWVTQEGDFNEKSVHHLGLVGSIQLGSFRPGIHVRFPLDEDLREDLDVVYGLQLVVSLPG